MLGHRRLQGSLILVLLNQAKKLTKLASEPHSRAGDPAMPAGCGRRQVIGLGKPGQP
jgi:hypothetical protein